MANIIPLKDNTGAQFYPQTHEKAVIDSNGVNLQTKLASITTPTYVTAWDGASTPVVANIPAGVTVTYNTTSYTGTLAASASTANKTYLVSTGTTDNYNRYVTQLNGSTYSWQNIGSTEIDLSDYATLEELNQLGQEVEDLYLGMDGQKYNYRKGGLITTNRDIKVFPGWNITDYIPVKNGDTIVWRFGAGPYPTNANVALALFGSDYGYLDFYSHNGYQSAQERTVTLALEGVSYIMASFSDTYKGKSNLSPISINGVNWERKEGIDRFTDDPEAKFWKEFPLGKLVQKDIKANSGNLQEGVYTNKRVSTDSLIAVPFEGMRLRLRVPHNYPYLLSAYAYIGHSDGALNKGEVGIYAYQDGVFPAEAKTLRLNFRARARFGSTGGGAWADLSVAEVEEWLASGELALEYYDADVRNTIERNESIEVQVAAARRVLNVADNVDNGMNLLPVFGHISDIHGDVRRFQNYMEFCDAMGADFALNTGDSTLYDHPDHTSFVDAVASKANTPMLFCIGNHESWPTGQATLFEDNMQTLVYQQGYLKDDNTPADHCYYYKDFPAKKIRVIAINYYEGGVYAGALGQTQIDWFISTLISTPIGYGIIVLIHSPEDHVIAPTGYDKFMQPSPKYGDTYQTGGFFIGNRPIMQIIDAFIGKTTLSTSYTDDGSTVTISADFTGVDASTEFIAYCCGHRHEDNIGYYEHANHKQLCLGVVCGIALFGDDSNSAWANQSDLPRGGKGASQDAFNVYAIDRVGGTVRIVRVGANVTIRFDSRDMMSIPYKDD